MAKTKLTLFKNQKNQSSKAAAAPPELTLTSLPPLTSEERAEAARFRALTATKAARQAMLHRIMNELQDLDEIESAA